MLADVVRNATLPDIEVDRERGVILDELAQRNSDPYTLLIDRMYAVSFPDHPYRHPPGGDPTQIHLRGRDTLAAFYHRTYAPERCSLVVVGDVSPENALQAAEAAFGSWTRSKPPLTVVADEMKPLPSPSASLLERADVSRSMVGIGFRAPAASDAMMACAALVTRAILGDSDSGGRLASSRLAGTEARIRYTPRQDASLFLLTAALPAVRSETEQERLTRAIALEQELHAVVSQLQTSPPTAAEIQAAKQRLLGASVFDLETNAGFASALGYADITGGDSPELFPRACNSYPSWMCAALSAPS